MTLELLANYHCVCGENPLWHPGHRRVYWTDIPAGKLFRLDPATGAHECCYHQPGTQIGGFTVQPDGALLLFMERGAIRVWRDGALTTVRDGLAGEEDSRFNDVIADPAGRVFCGTMSSKSHKGRLYRLETDGKIEVVLEGIGCSNGLGFTPDLRQLYYTDSVARELYRFDYDVASGAIGRRRVWAKVTKSGGIPDGLTVDAAGDVWGARWDGWRFVRYSPDGRERQTVRFPTARKVSSVIFGGPDYRDLYVTTAGGDKPNENGPDAGALFRLPAAGQGVAEFPSRLRVG